MDIRCWFGVHCHHIIQKLPPYKDITHGGYEVHWYPRSWVQCCRCPDAREYVNRYNYAFPPKEGD